MNEYKPEGTLIKSDKNYYYLSSRSGLERALENQIILEAPVVLCDHNFDLHLQLPSGIKGIIPKDEVEYSSSGEHIKDIAILTRVGKTVSFKVIGFKTSQSGECIAILSRRAAQIECIENYLKTLLPGDIIPAKVTHLERFGAFVDIGCGRISLLSIDSISVSRISHPSSRLSVGDNIYTVVRSIDEQGRIFLSGRELLGTWEENAALFSEGQTVRGIIRSVESYGVFVELMPNLAGLAEYRDDVYPGQSAAVYIKSIITDKMKIKLIIIDAQDNISPPTPLSYFIDPRETSHISYWKYSPSCSNKIIETVF
jgi:small subunit ribosomal protein S1